MADSPGIFRSHRQEECNPPTAFYPNHNLPNGVEPRAVAAEWIVRFSRFIQTEEVSPPTDTFFDESYWRDHLCFSWCFHTSHGPDEITSFLRGCQKACGLCRLSIDEDSTDKRPKIVQVDFDEKVHGVQLYIKFETDKGAGKGLARLLYDAGSGKWKAFTLYTALIELRGHAETIKTKRLKGHSYRPPRAPIEFGTWQEMRKAQENFLENLQPTVLIIGEAALRSLGSS